MKKRKINFIKLSLFFAPLILVGFILMLQTQLSILNQEYNENKVELSRLQSSNDDLEMQINESLTRDNISKIADSQGLVQSVSNVIDLTGDNSRDE